MRPEDLRIRSIAVRKEDGCSIGRLVPKCSSQAMAWLQSVPGAASSNTSRDVDGVSSRVLRPLKQWNISCPKQI
jgi:hypothetical protein